LIRVQTLAEIRSLLDAHGLAPKKSLGQNFLIDHNLIRLLVETSGVQSGDVVLEIGPGIGSLTLALLETGARVVAVEIDPRLAAQLPVTMDRPSGPRHCLFQIAILKNGTCRKGWPFAHCMTAATITPC
jgi:hypothetical protein